MGLFDIKLGYIHHGDGDGIARGVHPVTVGISNDYNSWGWYLSALLGGLVKKLGVPPTLPWINWAEPSRSQTIPGEEVLRGQLPWKT